MKKIIFDIETRSGFEDTGIEKVEDYEVSVLSLYDSITGKYYSFLQKDFDKMWAFFENADLIITFNGNSFDLPVLKKYAPFDLKRIKHLDIFGKIQESIGKKISLNNIAENTLKDIKKSGAGWQAVAWWNSGEIDKIIKYCEQDVKVTKEVYEYALKNEKLFYKDKKTKEKKEIILDISSWENGEDDPQNTLTLF